MLLKNILLGLGGTAAIGGIGYGIYVSSQSSSEEEKSSIRESEEATKPEALGSGTNSGVGNGGDSQKERGNLGQNDDKDSTKKGDNPEGEQALNTNGITPGIPPAA